MDDEITFIAKFLKSRGVDDSIINQFTSEKMNKEAVNAASDDVLKEFGLCAKGDIIALRAVCFKAADTSTERIEELKTNIRSNNRLANKNEKKKSVTFGWMNYDIKLKRYKAVRAKSGGGSRTTKVLENSSKEDLLGLAQELFCNNKRLFEKNFGPMSMLKFELGSFNEHVITNEFVLGDYIAENRLSKVRLYLMTRRINFFDLANSDDDSDDDFQINYNIGPSVPSRNQSSTTFSDDQANTTEYNNGNDSDAEFEINPFNSVPGSSLIDNSRSASSEAQDISADSKLIGTSIERRILAEERERAYNESSRIDLSKEEQCIKEKEREMLAANLRERRHSRVLPEPQLYDDHVIISIRHPDRGTVRRIFKTDLTMNSVYDWVGSLATLPMYFKLSSPNMNFIEPSQSVQQYSKVVLNFSESDIPVQLEADGEITWPGFASDQFSYADEEAEKMMANLPLQKEEDLSVSNVDCSCKLKDSFTVIRDELISQMNVEGESIICHRRPASFWPILFRQNIDLRKVNRVIWAGETCFDEGGPFREFLLHSMENLPILSTHFFGNNSSLFFTAFPEGVIKKHYFLLGQLTAMSVLLIGRGPHSFHPDMVNYIFTRDLPTSELTDVDHGEMSFNISQIKLGNTSCLVECNIAPTSSIAQNVTLYCQYFCFISKTSAIDQFCMGMASICPKFTDNACCMKMFFLKDTTKPTLLQVRSAIKFKREFPTGSNLAKEEEEAMIEIELFLSELERGENDLNLVDFLKFTAATDRIPFIGLHKNIDVHFVGGDRLPWSSTCGLILFVPRSVTREKLYFAMKECIGFGSV